jgi:hypothetical protein
MKYAGHRQLQSGSLDNIPSSPGRMVARNRRLDNTDSGIGCRVPQLLGRTPPMTYPYLLLAWLLPAKRDQQEA